MASSPFAGEPAFQRRQVTDVFVVTYHYFIPFTFGQMPGGQKFNKKGRRYLGNGPFENIFKIWTDNKAPKLYRHKLYSNRKYSKIILAQISRYPST